MTVSEVLDSWPVIIHTSLKNEFISQYLQSQEHKVRFSDNILTSTVIFPKSSIAFLIAQGSHLLGTNSADGLKNEFIERLEKFTVTHRNCYLLIKSSTLDDETWKAIQEVQTRFLNTHLQVILSEKDMDCIQSMITIAQAACKPASLVLQSKLKQHLDGQLTIDAILRMLGQTGLSEHDCLVLQQGLGSISNIVQGTMDQLLDCSLSQEAVKVLQSFLDHDCQ